MSGWRRVTGAEGSRRRHPEEGNPMRGATFGAGNTRSNARDFTRIKASKSRQPDVAAFLRGREREAANGMGARNRETGDGCVERETPGRA
jgi:hypothetical protein